MSLHGPMRGQRGATLAVGLIMLTLITVMVASAFQLSTTDLKSVGNMQVRDEAVAAANKAIEQVLSSPFTASPAGESIDVDLNNDAVTDYTVVFATPTCVNAAELVQIVPPSSISLGSAFTAANSDYFQTSWDLNASVTDIATGAAVRVHQGVRVLLTQVQYNTVCT